MTNSVSVLNVLFHGKPIGTLTRVAGDRTLFAFNDTYIDDPNRPTLSLGFKDNLGRLMTDFNPVQTRLMPFFSNLLPEGRMRTYLAARAGVNPEREFFLLWVLGKDLPGAITVEPADGEAWPSDVREASERMQENARRNALRFSLAGVQLKFSAVENARHGLTIPAKGIGGSWIVKLPSREFENVPENEYSMMTLARLVGIDVPAIKLIDVETIENLPRGIETLKGQALAVERFDRLSDGSLVHIEDFAQIFRVYPAEKYRKASAMNLATVIGTEGGEASIVEFVRRLTFNALIGNADMHLKNWSIIYPNKRSAVLAPAYDFVSTIVHIPDDSAALKVSRSKRFDQFSLEELAHMASRARLPGKIVADTARETVELFQEHWRAERKNLPLAAAAVRAVNAHLKKIPLVSEAAAHE